MRLTTLSRAWLVALRVYLLVAVALVVVLAPTLVSAQSATPSPAPSASPTPPAGTLRLNGAGHITFISSSSSGPGVTPPEGPGFAAGSPLSPLTPYDVFSSAPLVSGNAGEAAFVLRPDYFGRAFDLSLALGIGAMTGSMTNAAYWGEPLFTPLNPHLGSQVLPYRIVFPTHPGQDDASAVAASVLSGQIASKDGNLKLRAGWFTLAQGDPFTFTQPAVANVPPSLAFVTPESLGDGPPNLDAWTTLQSVLPLHGVDLFAKRGLASLELADAALPSLSGTGARLHSASLVIDHGEGTRYSAAFEHVATGGDPVSTTILFGANPSLLPSPQGDLPTSMVNGQRQTIFGARASFHVNRSVDGVVEYGHSTYEATLVAQPGTSRPGNYYHLGVTHALGSGSLALDGYWNGPFYATTIVPYGIPENVWSVAWSWPGQWLKSNYQLINNFPVNVDRQGYRAKYVLKTPAIDLRLAYATFGEIKPITYSNALRTGFVDGFFLPQPDNAATLGRQHQYLLYAGWHAPFGDLSFDYAEDTMHRSFEAGRPQDYVSYDSPEYVVTYTRRFRPGLLASIGYGRYAMRGSFSQAFTNVDYAQRSGIAGVEWAMSPHAALLVSVRRNVFAGIPPAPGGPSPNFTNTLLTVEQRYRF
jgi:hypothetical protein